MIKVDVSVDINAMKRSLNEVERKLVPRAAASALNKTAIAARKVADQEIRKRFNLKSRVVKDNLTIKRASTGSLVSIVEASGRPLPLRDYDAREVKRGVSYRVSKVKGRRIYKRAGIGAFVLESRGGHVFVRVEPDPPGPKKGKIVKVFGPSLPQYFVTRIIRSAMLAAIKDTWPKRFKEEMNFQLLRARGQL